MYCFICGSDPYLTAKEAYNELVKLVNYASTLEGFIEARVPPQPELRKVVLCFDSMEALVNAQWMLDLNGCKPEGGADREGHNTDDHNDQPGDGTGDGGPEGTGEGSGLPEDL